MKFLTISKMKDTASTMPPSVMRQLMEATSDRMKQETKAGGILEYYFIPGWDRVVAISEVKNAEEIVQRLAFEAMKTYVESMKAAEKMFPGPPK